MEEHFRNYQRNHQFQEKGRENYCWKSRKKRKKKLKHFQKLLDIDEPGPSVQSEQAEPEQSSGGNVYQETDQELMVLLHLMILLQNFMLINNHTKLGCEQK